MRKISYPNCLKIKENPQDPEGYVGLAREGYYLVPMSNFPWVDFTRQRDQFPTGVFHTMACFKSCPLGFYFDFTACLRV